MTTRTSTTMSVYLFAKHWRGCVETTPCGLEMGNMGRLKRTQTSELEILLQEKIMEQIAEKEIEKDSSNLLEMRRVGKAEQGGLE